MRQEMSPDKMLHVTRIFTHTGLGKATKDSTCISFFSHNLVDEYVKTEFHGPEFGLGIKRRRGGGGGGGAGGGGEVQNPSGVGGEPRFLT